MWYYEYVVRFFDEIDEEEVMRQGVVAANGYAEAVENIAEYYGNDYICSVEKLMVCQEILYEFNMGDNGFKVEVVQND